MNWKPIELPILDKYRHSEEAVMLDSTAWPKWAQKSLNFTRVALYCPSTSQTIIAPESTAQVIAKLITERYDIKDYPDVYNHNYYLIVESTNGVLLQSEPIKTSSPPHHSSSPSTWLNDLEPPNEFMLNKCTTK